MRVDIRGATSACWQTSELGNRLEKTIQLWNQKLENFQIYNVNIYQIQKTHKTSTIIHFYFNDYINSD